MRLSIFTIRDQIGGSATFSACENSKLNRTNPGGGSHVAAMFIDFDDRDTRQTSVRTRLETRLVAFGTRHAREKKKRFSFQDP